MVVNRKGLLAGLLLGAGAAGAGAAGVGLTLPQAQARAAQAPAGMSAGPVAPLGAPSSFADIFQRVSPAVVSIVVTTKLSPSEASELSGVPYPFNQLPQFQNRPGARRGAPATPRGRAAPGDGEDGGSGDADGPEAQAAGSGFFISADGLLVTNNHVVENSTKITVTLTDGRELDAKVVGRDEGSDLAVLKVAGSGFPFVAFELQAKPRVGDWVLAVGNPLQLGGTATAGIVSYVGRDLPIESQGALPGEYLQIDAPINRGNSGGPTFDVYGRVIGVNTAIYSQTGGSIGIGFAVPSETADAIVRDLAQGKTIQRGYLGASIQDLSTEGGQALGLSIKQGASIAEVVPDGPGAKGGLQPGDVVLTFNGAKVVSSSALTRAVAHTHAGDEFRLGVLRGGRQLSLTVRSGVRPSQTQLNAALNGKPGGGDETPTPGAGPSTSRSTTLGIGVGLITPAIRQAAGIPASVQGVVIESVRAGSDAARKQLTKGDVIVQANQQPVRTPADLVAALAAARKEGRPAVFLLVNHQGRNAGLAVKFDDRQ